MSEEMIYDSELWNEHSLFLVEFIFYYDLSSTVQQ